MNVLKLANISSIIEGNKKPQILSVIHFSSGNLCGLLFLLNRILSVTVILKVITVIIWLSKDNVNVRTQFEAAGTHNEEEYIMTNWKTKGTLDNTPCHSQITKKNGGEEKKVKLLLSIQWFLNKSLPCEVPQEKLHHQDNSVVWKKCKPFTCTVKGDAFKCQTDAMRSCHAVALCLNEKDGSGARKSAGSPWSSNSKALRNTFQSIFCLRFLLRHQFTIYVR